MKSIDKLLIANRGEIAVRIIRAARDLGIPTVAIYSDADRDAMHVQLADEQLHIGPALATKSYLDQAVIIQAALKSNATAIHPGYGFLAENASFAHACAQAGLTFVGPSAEAIARMGDKALARRTAQEANVATVPGTPEPISHLDEARFHAGQIGYPVMIKAAAGGGGRGIRIAEDEQSLSRFLPIAQQEAAAAFGDPAVYLEKLLTDARHIEVQVLGDGQRAVHLYERECSLQRKRQKIVEEALAPTLSPALRAELTAAAVRLTEAVGYSGAGTLEFLVDEDAQAYYFIEMNTRIQVEHPVTEMVCSVDLVREQLWIAAGQALRIEQDAIQPRGCAIECRINAENPDMNFMPHPGRIDGLHLPSGPWVRVDTALYSGYTVPPFYDSLVAKLIVWGEDRNEAIRRMRRALNELQVDGISTTRPMLQRLMENPGFIQARYHTNYLESWLNGNGQIPV